MNTKFKIIGLIICTILGVGVIAQFFSLSEKMLHYNNKFIRRYPQHVAQEVAKIDLTYNSYYFAGQENGNIYLGNYTAPFQLLELDSTLTKRTVRYITLKEQDLPFRSPQIRVSDNHFYVFEGIVPYVYLGSTSNWKASLRKQSGYYFSHFEPMDSVNAVVRYLAPKSGESLIGTLHLTDTTKVNYGPNLLEKQFDGIFDTDGSLHFNKELQRIVYVYRYRNEYIVAKPNLDLDYRGNTIDTISKAQIKLVELNNNTLKKFAEPPLVVNKTSAVSNNLLYVHSMLPGLYEDENIWKIASIVDVYDLTDASYRSSFPIYHIDGKRMKSMLVTAHYFYALIGKNIVRYKLRDPINQNRAARDVD